MSETPADKKPGSPAAKRPRKATASAEDALPVSSSVQAEAPAEATSAAAEAPADAVEIAAETLAASPAVEPPAPEAVVAQPKTKAAKVASASEATEAATPTTTAGVTIASAPAQKGTKIMATEKVQAMFGDLNERAKAAMEKSSKFVEELTDLTKGNVEAIVTSSRVAAKGAETLGQEAVEYGKKSFETATATFKSFAGAKSPSELYQLQSDYAKTAFDSAITEASKVSEHMVKLAGEIFQPISTRYTVAMEKLKATAL
ncbi:phasin family protein [Flavisphingomonas formosensis]|uniref:phasin family protein n=1 Tax=Flavisphingomonas formosensis TaxID=861534 RepID=UPI0012FCFE67|nr:phasin family protein [Sphingomonas formosensis]